MSIPWPTRFFNGNCRLDQEDRDKLSHAVIAIAGLGGIGCPAVEILTRNAVGNFRLADIDQYEPSNARQLS